MFNPLTHATLWSLFFNIGGLVVGTIIFPQEVSEERIAEEFLNINNEDEKWNYEEDKNEYIVLEDKLKELRKILTSFFSIRSCEEIINLCLDSTKLLGKEKISILSKRSINPIF
jgi:hypothetical protein